MANLEQEATYLELHRRGIDVILKITLLNNTKNQQGRSNKVSAHPSSLYYYNYIWSYKKLQTNAADTNRPDKSKKDYYLESIFFDLQTLQPIYSVQTKPFHSFSFERMQQEYGRLLVKDMLLKKILVRQAEFVKKPIKPF